MRRVAGFLGLAIAGSGGAFALVGGCQTPTSITFRYRTDADCAAEGQRTVAVVVGRAEDVRDVGEPTSTKTCEVAGRRGQLEPVGTLVALPSDTDGLTVGMRVVLGVTRRSEECGSTPDPASEAGDVWGGCIVARRRLAFLDGEALTVDVPLHQDCIGVPCDDDTTCVPERGCVDAGVSPEDCVGEGCGTEQLGSGSASVGASGSTGPGGGEGGGAPTSTSDATTTSSSASSGGGEGGAGGASSSSSAGGGGAGGGNAECVDDEDCEDPPLECVGPSCDDGLCGQTILLGAPCTDLSGGTCNEAGQCCADQLCGQVPLGTPCLAQEDCIGNSCVDGVCCDDDCTGLCRSCRAQDTGLENGQCGLIQLGLDPADECGGACGACSSGLCTTVTPCDGACDGAQDGDPCEECVGNLVSYATCTGGICGGGGPKETSAPDARDLWPAPGLPPVECPGNFVCRSGQGCLTACDEGSDCLLGFSCIGSACVEG